MQLARTTGVPTRSDQGASVTFGQAKPVVVRDPAIAAREAEIDRVFDLRNELNREMMRLPVEERRKRWNEYCARLRDLMKQLPE